MLNSGRLSQHGVLSGLSTLLEARFEFALARRNNLKSCCAFVKSKTACIFLFLLVEILVEKSLPKGTENLKNKQCNYVSS